MARDAGSPWHTFPCVYDYVLHDAYFVHTFRTYALFCSAKDEVKKNAGIDYINLESVPARSVLRKNIHQKSWIKRSVSNKKR